MWPARALGVVALLTACFCAPSQAAAADWLITPFLGVKLDGNTNLVDLDQAAGGTELTVGGSVALLGSGLFGLEADLGYSPGFFDSSARSSLVARSNVTTVMGSVVIAVPSVVTRDSLRPYVVAGVGLMHAGITDKLNLFPLSINFLAMSVGGGAIGRLTPRTSVRFDIRRFQSLSQELRAVGFGPSRLSFWRADVGLTFRY